MYGWACQVRQVVPDAVDREYVDDLTTYREHNDPGSATQPVHDMIAVTQQLSVDAHLRLNTTKSCCFSTSSTTRAELGASATLPAAPAFVDLGVDQCTSRQPRNAKRKRRASTHDTRCSRIGLIPASLKSRGMLTSMSSTSTGCYAPEANPIPRTLVRSMRHSAFQAAWRNTFRCAPEIAFTLYVPWRAGPSALASVNPLTYLRGAIRRGVTTALEMQAPWHSCTECFVGPIAAAKQALLLAGLRSPYAMH